MHLYQICYNARRMDRHSEAELWARFTVPAPGRLRCHTGPPCTASDA